MDEINIEEKLYNPKYYPDDELVGKSGVYQIRNLENGKMYIGSSCRLYDRKLQHKNDLKNNRHENIHLQHAFNKYGIENFIFEIIEFCIEEEQYIIEQYWLDKFYGKEFCYNINPIASKPPNNKGKKRNLTEEKRKELNERLRIRNLLTQSFKGQNNPMYGLTGEKNPKSVQFISLADNVIYGGFREYVRITGKNRTIPKEHCQNKLKNKPQQFMYLNDYNLLSTEEKEIARINAIKSINKSKIVRLLDNKIYDTVKECLTDNDIKESSLYRQLNNIKESNKFMRYIDWLKQEGITHDR